MHNMGHRNTQSCHDTKFVRPHRKLWQTVASPVATILAWQLSDFNVVNGLIYKDIFEGVFGVNIFIVILNIVPKVQRPSYSLWKYECQLL